MGPTATASAASDYRALRERAGVVDLGSWTLLSLTGADARTFLQGVATRDLQSGPPNAALKTYFLSERGRPVALAWVGFPEGESRAWVIADSGARQTLRSHFERFRVMEDVEIAGPEGPPYILGAAGPRRASLLRELAKSHPGSSRLDADPLSFLLVPGPHAEAATPRFADPAAFEAWRLAVGLPRTGVDFDLDRIATELSDPDAISLDKGCYVGQEVVARTSNRGQARRRRVGFRFDWGGEPIPPRAELRACGVAAGFVTSTAPEPGADQGLGMGYVSVEALEKSLEALAIEGSQPTRLRVGPWPL